MEQLVGLSTLAADLERCRCLPPGLMPVSLLFDAAEVWQPVSSLCGNSQGMFEGPGSGPVGPGKDQTLPGGYEGECEHAAGPCKGNACGPFDLEVGWQPLVQRWAA